MTENNRDLAGLELFVRIAESGSLSRTAQMLQTTQPAISRRIAAVESAWGGQLFHRTGRGVVLTEMGERALPKARELLEQADLLAAQISRTKALPSGVVRIATLPSIAALIVPPLLDNIRERQSDVRVEIVEGDSGQIEEWHGEGRFDIAIFYRYGRPQQLETPLATAESCLIGRADDPLLDAETIAFRQLHGLPLALPPRPSATRNVLDLVSSRQEVDLNVVIEPTSSSLQTLVAEQKGHYTILPRFAVEQAVTEGRLKAVRIVDPPMVRIIVASQVLHRPLGAAAREIFAFIQAVLRKAIPK
ncbi:LysR family transcriptional regulator [Sphingobium sp. 15-1]|nr:LysR family transcriptional regulator [Sphingobium sp. 15-1]